MYSVKNVCVHFVLCVLVSTVGKCCGMLWYAVVRLKTNLILFRKSATFPRRVYAND